MKRLLIPFAFIVLLGACGQQAANGKLSAIPFNAVHSTRTDTSITPPMNMLEVPMQFDNSLFSVYELSATTTAITVNINESNVSTIFDSIFNQLSLTDSLGYSLFDKPKNCYYFDTIGEYKLLKSDKLEIEIKKHLDKVYYIYGTKGVARYNVKNVLFGLDECRTNILGFTIENFDTVKYGHPIICSKQHVKFNYKGNFTEIENKIDLLYQNEQSDYTDSVKTRVFANLDSLYFAYSDDFIWGKFPERRKCLFPSRIIFVLQKDGTIKRKWADGLDLFGIPCD